MSKLRIYEYAKQNNMSSKEIITILNRLNVEVNNHMSVMDEKMIEAVERFKQDVKSRAATAQEKRMEEARAENRAEQNRTAVKSQPSAALDTSDGAKAADQPVRSNPRQSDQRNSGKPTGEQRNFQDSRTAGGRPQDRPQGGRPQDRSQGGRPQNAGNVNAGTNQRQGQGQGHGQGQGQGHGQSQGNRSQGKHQPQNGQHGQQSRSNFGNRQPNAQRSQGQQKQPQLGNQAPLVKVYEEIENDRRGAAPRDERIPSGKRKNPAAPAGNANRSQPTAKGKGGESGGNRGNVKSGRSNDFGKGSNRGGRHQVQSKPSTPQKLPDPPKQIEIEGPMTVGELAKTLRREAGEVIKKLLFLGIMATINQEIEPEAITLVAADYGSEVILKEPVDQEALDMLLDEDQEEDLVERPPVVTIMGHVDHGKTTLLDAIRQTNVTASEAGGITQHIGAYQVEINGKKITFLDTPGHAAFTSMRARGAQVTDITILVVAADDGVMPQTIEAINHAKAANVPIIVAVNKIDKPAANLDRIKQELTEYGLVAEDWGGDTIFSPVSALKKQGLEELLEMILLVSEVAELKADPNARSRGTVIEAQLDKNRGPAATVLVQNGTLRVGDIVVAGSSFGRVRAMVNDHGRRVKEAPPSYPVEIVGLNDVPSAGDLFVVYDDERKARMLTERRQQKQRAETLGAQSRVTLDDLYKQIQEGEVKDLNVIIKGDVQGSVEALAGSLAKIDVQGARVKIIHRGVGAVTESDILLATASNAIVMGFNVRPEVNAAKMAESEKVDIRLYRVIYNAIEEIESAMKGLLDPEFKEVIVGRAEIRQTFKVSKIGTIAGSYVTEGKITRQSEVRIIRSGIIVYEGKLDTLKRFKDDVREVLTGFECGITFERFNDVKEGDIIEAFMMEQIKVQ